MPDELGADHRTRHFQQRPWRIGAPVFLRFKAEPLNVEARGKRNVRDIYAEMRKAFDHLSSPGGLGFALSTAAHADWRRAGASYPAGLCKRTMLHPLLIVAVDPDSDFLFCHASHSSFVKCVEARGKQELTTHSVSAKSA
jgi:hypothetical protein